MASEKIMIIDDDTNICKLLDIYVSSEGYKTTMFQSGVKALEHMTDHNPNLVLLDVAMPEMDGFEVLEQIRKKWNVPVIMLTARDWIGDKVLGFELGADDYILKPFEPLEVLARIKARLRERSKKRGEIVHLNNVSLDINYNIVTVDNVLLPIKRKEIQLLHYMLNHRNLILTRDELLSRVWHNDDGNNGTRTVDMHVKRLREKLNSAGADIEIRTVWGAGYMLVEEL